MSWKIYCSAKNLFFLGIAPNRFCSPPLLPSKLKPDLPVNLTSNCGWKTKHVYTNLQVWTRFYFVWGHFEFYRPDLIPKWWPCIVFKTYQLSITDPIVSSFMEKEASEPLKSKLSLCVSKLFQTQPCCWSAPGENLSTADQVEEFVCPGFAIDRNPIL